MKLESTLFFFLLFLAVVLICIDETIEEVEESGNPIWSVFLKECAPFFVFVVLMISLPIALHTSFNKWQSQGRTLRLLFVTTLILVFSFSVGIALRWVFKRGDGTFFNIFAVPVLFFFFGAVVFVVEAIGLLRRRFRRKEE